MFINVEYIRYEQIRDRLISIRRLNYFGFDDRTIKRLVSNQCKETIID